MARRPSKVKVCVHPGCPNLTDGGTRCDAHRPAYTPWPDRDERRPKVSGWERQRRNKIVMARHGRVCHVCGQGGADQVDHVVPLAQGGSDTMDNLRPAHKQCHAAKTRRESAEGRSHPRASQAESI